MVGAWSAETGRRNDEARHSGRHVRPVHDRLRDGRTFARMMTRDGCSALRIDIVARIRGTDGAPLGSALRRAKATVIA